MLLSQDEKYFACAWEGVHPPLPVAWPIMSNFASSTSDEDKFKTWVYKECSASSL